MYFRNLLSSSKLKIFTLKLFDTNQYIKCLINKNRPRDRLISWEDTLMKKKIWAEAVNSFFLQRPYILKKVDKISPFSSLCCAMVNCSVVSDSFQPHELYLQGSSCPWDSPGKNTGVGCHALLQGIFPSQGSNPGILHCRKILYHLSHQGSPYIYPNHTERWTDRQTDCWMDGWTDRFKMLFSFLKRPICWGSKYFLSV